MKQIPIELTYDRISNENLIKFSKSMKTLEDTILSLISRIDENGFKKLNEIVGIMSNFNISEQRARVDKQIDQIETLKEVADSIESEFSNVIVGANDIDEYIDKYERIVCGIEEMVFKGNPNIDSPSSSIVSQYDKILSLFGDDEVNPTHLKPKLITDVQLEDNRQSTTEILPASGTPRTYSTDNAAFLYSSYRNGCLQVYRTKTALENLMGIDPDNVYIEQSNCKEGEFSYWGDVDQYHLWFDYPNKLQDSSMLNAKNLLFVCIQVTKKYDEWGKIINSVNSIVKNNPNCRIFAIVDAQDVPTQFIQSLSNPALIWYSTTSVHTSIFSINKVTLGGRLFGSNLGGAVINSLLSLIYTGHSYVALNYDAMFEKVKERSHAIGDGFQQFQFSNGDLFATSVNGFNQNTRFMT